ncbi:MAG: frataxin domain-containing protein [Terracidiphilus sp.]
MRNHFEFGIAAEAALDGLKRHLIAHGEEEQVVFEVEQQKGILNVLFDHPGVKFVIAPNMPLHQIWISAPATSFMLNWDSGVEEFILPRTGETLIGLVERLIGERRAA